MTASKQLLLVSTGVAVNTLMMAARDEHPEAPRAMHPMVSSGRWDRPRHWLAALQRKRKTRIDWVDEAISPF
jgi:hypothetical protein